MNLSDCTAGTVARVRAISAESTVALRLREMGLRPGARIRLAGVGAAGARIVAIGAARLAIDATTSRHIEVEAA
ncbi:FeoA family protein [Demequina pelophila]|uniref:FeoA family protein n=1 Tax=Demequina pelophila TaxID=1638984 RepID=UPI0007817D4A|nr:FeoA family protein [Demequina pelophila]